MSQSYQHPSSSGRFSLEQITQRYPTHDIAEFTEAPVVENAHVRLEQLAHRHAEDLIAAVAPGQFRKTWYTSIPSPEKMGEEIENRLAKQQKHMVAPWAIIDPSTDRAVGMTTYLNVDPAKHRLEIGSTWLGSDAQGTRINPAAKRLLLQRAFEDLHCIAVEFRTHWHNRQSRAAIAKLGAKQDGVLRNHEIYHGTLRDTVVFSILDHEWPTVRQGLDARL